jgi:hypothetical protein
VSLQAESVKEGYTPVRLAAMLTNVVAIQILRRRSFPIHRLHRLHRLHLLRWRWWLVVLLLLCRRWQVHHLGGFVKLWRRGQWASSWALLLLLLLLLLRWRRWDRILVVLARLGIHDAWDTGSARLVLANF